MKGNLYLDQTGERVQRHRIDDYHRRGRNESRNTDSPSTKCQWSSRKTDEQVEVRATSCLEDGKLSLKVDEPQVGQRRGHVERKREYHHIIIFLEGT